MASSKLEKLEARLASKQRSVATKAQQRDIELGNLAGGAAVGVKERFGWNLPSIPGIPDEATYSIALYMVAQKTPGSWGRSLRGAAVGIATCGVRDAVAGKLKLGAAGDDESYVDV